MFSILLNHFFVLLTIQSGAQQPAGPVAAPAAPLLNNTPAKSVSFSNQAGAGSPSAGIQVQTSSTISVPVGSLTVVRGIRENQLTGFGIIVGLAGTGDTSNFAKQQIQNLAKVGGMPVSVQDLTANNIAIVVVTATLPPYPEAGKRINVTVSSYGDAKSLEGGTLMRCPLTGAIGGDAVAVAQGAVVLGGFTAGGQAATVKKNHTTAGIVPMGAILESGSALAQMKPISEGNSLFLDLKQEEASVSDKIAKAINVVYPGIAFALNPGTIRITVPANCDEMSGNFPNFLSSIQQLQVVPFERPRILLDEKSSTVVITGTPQLSECVIVRGNLTITIAETPSVSQPTPFSSGGSTQTVPRTSVTAKEESRGLSRLPATSSLSDLAAALSSLGATPRELVGILAFLQGQGALYADIVQN